MTPIKLLRPFVLASLALGCVSFAQADGITAGPTFSSSNHTLAPDTSDYEGSFYDFSSTFPPASISIGNFSFTIPKGVVVTGATISGTFGDVNSPTTALTDLHVLNGSIEVAGCDSSNGGTVYPPCAAGTLNGSLVPWSYSFTPTDLNNLASNFASGTLDFTAVQKSFGAVVVGTPSLNVQYFPPFLTGFGLNSPPMRNNFSGFAGMEVTVGAKQLTVYSLGRLCLTGNSQTHIVKLVNQSTMLDEPGASASVNMTGCTPGTFVYETLASPVSLPPGTTHFLASQEFNGGDKWYDQGTISALADASVVGSAYLNGATWVVGTTPNVSFVPPSMVYSAATATTAFVLNYNQNNQALRNDFSGFAGMSLTAGAIPLSVTSVGRVCLPGNSQSHLVKFVNPSTGADVPGGSATVNMTGCTTSQFVYAPLSAPLTLQANTTYYVVSQETSGGDKWYDQATLTTTHDGAVKSSVYSNGGNWIGDAVNESYVPPNFQYSLVSVPPGAVTITVGTNIPGPSFTVDSTTYTTPQTFAWVSGSTHSIATATPQSAGTGTRWAFTSWSDSGALSHTVSPNTNTAYTASFNTQYLLTTNVTGSGSVGENPTSPDGYYNSGTSVALTASPNSGNVFFNWTGDLKDSANPQSITMAAPHSVTANFQPIAAATGFITGYGFNNPPLRSNFSGFVGMSLTVSGSPLSASAMGRVCVAGNSQTHTVKFVNAVTGVDVAGGSASVNMASCTPGAFVYTALGSPITLPAGGTYYLVSQETSGGDQWYDMGTVTVKSDATITAAVYQSGASYITIGSANESYVPPSFQYSVLPAVPHPFATAYNLTGRPLRNDFTGLVGLAFTVGGSSMSVSSVGRVCVTANSGTHLVELVDAATGVVVAGSSASVSMGGCTPGGFAYAALSSAITLPAGGIYYLVSQETSGGDQWYDFAPLTTTGAGQVTNSVYQDNGTWIAIGGPDTSYVPANFLYQ